MTKKLLVKILLAALALALLSGCATICKLDVPALVDQGNAIIQNIDQESQYYWQVFGKSGDPAIKPYLEKLSGSKGTITQILVALQSGICLSITFIDQAYQDLTRTTAGDLQVQAAAAALKHTPKR